MVKELNFYATLGKELMPDTREVLIRLSKEQKWCSACKHRESVFDGEKFVWYCGGKEISSGGTCERWEEGED